MEKNYLRLAVSDVSLSIFEPVDGPFYCKRRDSSVNHANLGFLDSFRIGQ